MISSWFCPRDCDRIEEPLSPLQTALKEAGYEWRYIYSPHVPLSIHVMGSPIKGQG